MPFYGYLSASMLVCLSCVYPVRPSAIRLRMFMLLALRRGFVVSLNRVALCQAHLSGWMAGH